MKRIIPLLALTAISAPAMSDDTYGVYGSLGGGVYRLQTDGFDETSPAATLLGGYSFNRNVAVEASYTRLFNASDRVDGVNVTVDGHIWDLSSKLSYPVGNRFSPYGRIGWGYVDMTGRASENGVSVRANEYDDAFTWAVGTGVKLNRRLALSGEYGRILVRDADLDRLTLNLDYRFGRQ